MTSVTFTTVCLALTASLANYGCGRDGRTPDDNATPAASDDTAKDTASADATTASNTDIRVADIVAAPNRYFGETVTVTADVEEVHTPLAFSLDEDAPLAGGVDRDLLVFSPKAGNLADIDDQWLNNRVRVTGKVGKMTVVEIEREVGWDLSPEIEAEVERASAVLIATSVERVNRGR